MEKRMLKPIEICDEIVNVYEHKAHYPVLKSIMLGVLAGAFIALGGFAAAVSSHSIENYGLSKLVSGAVFPVGLIMILIAGADLFTGNILLTVPLIDGKINTRLLLKNWTIIYLSNFIGALLVAIMIYNAGALDGNSFKIGGYALKVAINKASITPMKAIFSGILCNFLVCLAVWLSFAAKDIVGKIFAIWFPIMAFIIGGFEHSVANMYYFSVGFLAKNNVDYANSLQISKEKIEHLNIGDVIINNMIPVTIGNIIGGGIMIGIAFWIAFKSSARPQNVKVERSSM
jgi:formate/nitrite transporter